MSFFLIDCFFCKEEELRKMSKAGNSQAVSKLLNKGVNINAVDTVSVAFCTCACLHVVYVYM